MIALYSVFRGFWIQIISINLDDVPDIEDTLKVCKSDFNRTLKAPLLCLNEPAETSKAIIIFGKFVSKS